ncbi:MAG TPA: glycoside hydrolase family 3 N-terminal domain-containing protein [Longimicrobiales bacterium]|nr:glycoside hydrolase family 3 N-terminal domain-containing protein [Longimicrobiales bacterium]
MSAPSRLRRSAPARRLGWTLPAWLLLAAGCGGTSAAPQPAPAPEPDTAPVAAPPAVEVPPPPAPGGPPSAAEPEGAWAARTLAELTLEEKVGQLLMPWVLGDFAPEGSASHDRVLRYLQEQHVGGIIMSVGSPTEVAAKVNDLQRHAKHPLLVTADLETGAGFRMFGAMYMPGPIELGGATNFPSLMALGAAGDTALAYEMGRITAEEARAVGIHVAFGPVLDVNNNPDNPIINVRSFGEDPVRVGALGAAMVRGTQEHGAIATGKHFPGHGDTGVDSHLALPTISVSRERMDSVELPPFRDAIAAGMGAIMTAHITVPSINGGTGDAATLSPGVLTGLLRDELGFRGIVFTDAMDMAAISGRLGSGEAAVRAVLAGADVILMPASVEQAAKGLVDAVRSGRISAERLDASVLLLLRTKESLGLHREREVALERVHAVVGIPAHQQVADSIARRSVTVLRNGRDLLPLRGTRSARVLSVSYRRTTDLRAGSAFNGRLRVTYPRLVTAEVDRDTGSGVYDGLLRQARESALVVVSTYVTVVSRSGTIALPGEVSEFIQRLGEAGVPHVVVSFGNPYLIADFPDVPVYVLAWSGSLASQAAAAGALLGEFDVSGRTPTRIPGFAEIGDGIQIPRR